MSYVSRYMVQPSLPSYGKVRLKLSGTQNGSKDRDISRMKSQISGFIISPWSILDHDTQVIINCIVKKSITYAILGPVRIR